MNYHGPYETGVTAFLRQGSHKGTGLMKRIGIILVLLIAGCALAYRLLPPSENSRQAAEKLSQVTEFCFGPAGVGADEIEGERAFFTILHGRRPADLFARAFDRGTPEGRLYALCGLHVTDRGRYEICAARFLNENSNQVVHCISGCFISDHKTSDIITNLAAGKV